MEELPKGQEVPHKRRNPMKSIFLQLTPPRVLSGQHPRTQHPSGSVHFTTQHETRYGTTWRLHS